MRKLLIPLGLVLSVALAACGSSSQKSAKTTPKIAIPSVHASGASYHPKIDPAQFTTDITNRYWPIRKGTTWIYDGTKDGVPEHVVVTVQPSTKTIMGVKTVTIQDKVTINQSLEENTTDWYAQDKKQIPGVHDAVETAASKLTKDWLAKFYVDIKHLSDERQAVYADIRSQARDPEHQDTAIPEHGMEESKDTDGNLLPTRPLHVLADDGGHYPVGSLNDTEITVVDRELSRQQVIGWYRNPSQATAQAIRVPYRVGDTWRSMQPDFIFISQRDSGNFAASIVDPHSSHLSDALPKLIGLADFTERHGDAYLRIDALDENKNGDIVVLNMKDPDVRAAVRSATTTTDLYNGSHAILYK